MNGIETSVRGDTENSAIKVWRPAAQRVANGGPPAPKKMPLATVIANPRITVIVKLPEDLSLRG